jgi:hypothetical protein
VAQIAHAGTPEQIRAAAELLASTRRGIYQILAGDGEGYGDGDGDGEVYGDSGGDGESYGDGDGGGESYGDRGGYRAAGEDEDVAETPDEAEMDEETGHG